ncbi:MAG TPA: tungstate ABC transporter substrate-binding protein WtpA [Dehalococcoidia bacterium]|nr:tungstate ABC transporter substrate-binding protein WtpA [Dehalococcoidia bacterium]
MKRVVLPIAALALILTLVASACVPQPGLIAFHAGSLSVPFDKLAEEFEEQNPGITMVTEAAGSRTTIRKVTELGKPCDIIGSADYLAIEELMFPDYADWYIKFAVNEMVIVYRDDAPFADEVIGGERTWYDVLVNEDVTYGHSDPDVDPCGYRSLMVCQLAQSYYHDNASNFGLTPDDKAADLYDVLIPIPQGGNEMDRGRTGGEWGEIVKPKETDLLYLLGSGDLDYAFEYRSVAIQHGLDFVELPDEIDLSSIDFADFYATTTVEVTGSEPGSTATQTAAPIVYGVTIPSNAPHPDEALDFVELMLGAEGQAIIESCGQSPIVPAIASDRDKIPQGLRGFVAE